MINNLVMALRDGRFDPIVLSGAIVVLPHGGRVIGLYPDPLHNALWVQPRLYERVWLAKAVARPGWLNLGGDRTWISPEVETNIADPQRVLETYDVPKAIDPASYSVTAADERSVTLASDMNLRFRRSNASVHLRLTKTISVVKDCPWSVPAGVRVAAYCTECSLRMLATAPEGVHPAVWSLLQTPGGGLIDIPVKPGGSPRLFFGRPDFKYAASLISARVPAEVSFKVGLRPEHSPGLLLFQRDYEVKTLLVVRKFDVAGGEDYFDIPPDNPLEGGYATQFYVDDGKLGGFGELEYHTHGLDARKGRSELNDASMVWAFLGPAGDVGKLRQEILAGLPRAPGV